MQTIFVTFLTTIELTTYNQPSLENTTKPGQAIQTIQRKNKLKLRST